MPLPDPDAMREIIGEVLDPTKKSPVVGPTGSYPRDRPITDFDRGGCIAQMRVVKKHRQMMFDFGTTVQWVAMSPEETMKMVSLFRATVKTNWGDLSYNVAELPFKITANHEKRLIETDFRILMGVLCANPEVFLAYAQRLEEAVQQLQAKKR
jgi:hypothetical protein